MERFRYLIAPAFRIVHVWPWPGAGSGRGAAGERVTKIYLGACQAAWPGLRRAGARA